jgi:hypothetical protein
MTLIEALEGITNRVHIRRPHWQESQGLAVCMITGLIFYVDHNVPYMLQARQPHNGNIWKPRYEDIIAKDWELLKTDTILPLGLY